MNTVIQLKTPVERWAEKITTTYGETVQAIVEVGRQLIQAKAELNRGQWGDMTGEATGKPMIPFGCRTAQRYMAIADNPVLSNPTHGSDLPASWRTLTVLATLDPADLESAIADGIVNPEMQRKDAETLVAKLKPRKSPAPAESARPESAQVLTLPLAPRPATVTETAAEVAPQETALEISSDTLESLRNLGQQIVEFRERQEDRERIRRETYEEYPELKNIESAGRKSIEMVKDLHRLIDALPNIPVKNTMWHEVAFYVELIDKQLQEKLL